MILDITGTIFFALIQRCTTKDKSRPENIQM